MPAWDWYKDVLSLRRNVWRTNQGNWVRKGSHGGTILFRDICQGHFRHWSQNFGSSFEWQLKDSIISTSECNWKIQRNTSVITPTWLDEKFLSFNTRKTDYPPKKAWGVNSAADKVIRARPQNVLEAYRFQKCSCLSRRACDWLSINSEAVGCDNLITVLETLIFLLFVHAQKVSRGFQHDFAKHLDSTDVWNEQWAWWDQYVLEHEVELNSSCSLGESLKTVFYYNYENKTHRFVHHQLRGGCKRDDIQRWGDLQPQQWWHLHEPILYWKKAQGKNQNWQA